MESEEIRKQDFLCFPPLLGNLANGAIYVFEPEVIDAIAAIGRLSDELRATLGAVLPYFGRPVEESVRLIERLAREQGSVRNQDVQDLEGIQRDEAVERPAERRGGGDAGDEARFDRPAFPVGAGKRRIARSFTPRSARRSKRSGSISRRARAPSAAWPTSSRSRRCRTRSR